MSSATHRNSDSEDDDEYVPPAHEQPSSDSDNETQIKNQDVSPILTTEEMRNKQKDQDALWANFQASVASSSQLTPAKVEDKMVKVEKKYLFAGEYITEIMEVPEGSTETKKWPLYSGDTGDECIKTETPLTSTTSPEPISAVLPLPQKTRPGPRKPKAVLNPLPSSSAQKAKKLTTLDKSLMDWKAHTVDSPLQNELDANRKSGGYLERVEFLQRVEERKEENLESLKSRKRRKL